MDVKTTKFLDLPNEMIGSILSEIDLPELIECRLVSKRIKFVIDNLTKAKLFIDSYPNYKDPNKQQHLSKSRIPWSQKHLFRPYNPNLNFLLSHLSFRSLFLNSLKELNFCIPTDVELKIFDEFINLEKLFLSRIIIKKDQILSSPKLRHLIIEMDYEYNQDNQVRYLINIKSKIENFERNCVRNNWILEYPQCVESIHIRSFNDQVNLNQFKNLRTLKIKKGYGLIDDDDGIINELFEIENFEKLDELYFCHYSFPGSMFPYGEFFGFNETFTSYLNRLVRLKKEKKINFKKIYLFGIEIIQPFQDYYFKPWESANRDRRDSVLKSRLVHYDLLKNNFNDNNHIEYYDLISFIEGNNWLFDGLEKDKLIPILPIDFFTKFSNIQSVTLDIYYKRESNEENRFLIFFNKCVHLIDLDIIIWSKTELSQQFLDQLPDNCSELCFLTIKYRQRKRDDFLSYKKRMKKSFSLDPYKRSKIINFEFIYRLKYIEFIQIPYEIELESVLKLLKFKKHLRTLVFSYLDRLTTIEKISTKKIDNDQICLLDKIQFNIHCFNKNIVKFNLNECQLIEYAKNIKDLIKIEFKKRNKEKIYNSINGY